MAAVGQLVCRGEASMLGIHSTRLHCQLPVPTGSEGRYYANLGDNTPRLGNITEKFSVSNWNIPVFDKVALTNRIPSFGICILSGAKTIYHSPLLRILTISSGVLRFLGNIITSLRFWVE